MLWQGITDSNLFATASPPVCCCVQEVGVALTIVLLCWEGGSTRLAATGFYLQVAAFALAVTFSWATTASLVCVWGGGPIGREPG